MALPLKCYVVIDGMTGKVMTVCHTDEMAERILRMCKNQNVKIEEHEVIDSCLD